MTTGPTPPIPIDADLATARHDSAPLPDGFLGRLAATGVEVLTDARTRVEASRDWWPLPMTWAADAQVLSLASAVARPSSTDEVAAVVALCSTERVPITAAGGRSGVTGGSIPLFGGVVLDTTALAGIRSVDAVDGIVDVGAGTFGIDLEETLRRDHGLTVGHWPQSIALSTVGGWLACRGAGQLSNRYGKIEDIVVGLDVVLADGTVMELGGHARAATGPDLVQLFVGSEGTLGVITGARLRAHPLPTHTWRATWTFPSFAEAIDACRRIAQRGLQPAALRLYDAEEADRNWGTGDVAVLLALDEGDPVVVDAARAITEQECADATPGDASLADRWWDHRNDVSALEALISRGYMVDTLELTARWSDLATIHDAVRAAVRADPGIITCTAHVSHSYLDGACIYFTFAGTPASDAMYLDCWNAATEAALAAGGSLSHHHGIGLNRARFMRRALGDGAQSVLQSIKDALDPNGVCDPGKLGLRSPFGTVPAPFDVPSTPES